MKLSVRIASLCLVSVSVFTVSYPGLAPAQQSKTVKKQGNNGQNRAQQLYDEGIELGKADKFEEAIAAFQQALKVDANYQPAQYAVGFSYFQLQKYPEAIPYLAKAAELKADDVDCWHLLSICLSTAEQHKEAFVAVKKFLELSPNSFEAHYLAGVCHSNLGRPEEALAEYQQAIKLEPTFKEAYLNAAVLKMAALKFPAAIELLDQAVKLSPDFVEAHYNLGLCYFNQNDQEHANQEYAIVKRLNEEMAAKLLTLFNSKNLNTANVEKERKEFADKFQQQSEANRESLVKLEQAKDELTSNLDLPKVKPFKSVLDEAAAERAAILQTMKNDIEKLELKTLLTPTTLSTTENITAAQQRIKTYQGILVQAEKVLKEKAADTYAKLNQIDADPGFKNDFLEGYKFSREKDLTALFAFWQTSRLLTDEVNRLYLFLLSRQGAYTNQDNLLVFSKTEDANTYTEFIQKIRELALQEQSKQMEMVNSTIKRAKEANGLINDNKEKLK